MIKTGRFPGERMLCTQDHFRMDDEGFLYFVGRTDDIIKTRGEKVSPLEVENALFAITGVQRGRRRRRARRADGPGHPRVRRAGRRRGSPRRT